MTWRKGGFRAITQSEPSAPPGIQRPRNLTPVFGVPKTTNSDNKLEFPGLRSSKRDNFKVPKRVGRAGEQRRPSLSEPPDPSYPSRRREGSLSRKACVGDRAPASTSMGVHEQQAPHESKCHA
eukprot:6499825-Alexandrium_andersonii.AAC.1